MFPDIRLVQSQLRAGPRIVRGLTTACEAGSPLYKRWVVAGTCHGPRGDITAACI